MSLRDDLAGATPGPWRRTAVMRNGWSGIYPGLVPGPAPIFLTNDIDEADARAIVSVMNAAPTLLDVAEAARAVFGTAPGSEEEAALSALRAALDRLAVIEESQP